MQKVWCIGERVVCEFRGALLPSVPYNRREYVCACASGWQERMSTHAHPPEPNCEVFFIFSSPKQMLSPHLKYAVMVIN